MIVDFTVQVLADSEVTAYRYLAPDYRETDPDLREAFGMTPEPDTFGIRGASFAGNEGTVVVELPYPDPVTTATVHLEKIGDRWWVVDVHSGDG